MNAKEMKIRDALDMAARLGYDQAEIMRLAVSDFAVLAEIFYLSFTYTAHPSDEEPKR
jgi:hypothetical protein